jgi:23S rRNA pseudouridine1911/1915/1917 synthase
MLAGHPVVGEIQYREDRTTALVGFTRQALHARRLGLTHPTTGRPVSFEAPLPEDLARLVARLRAAGRAAR